MTHASRTQWTDGAAPSATRPAASASRFRTLRYGKSIGFVGADRSAGTTSTLLNLALVLANRQQRVIAAELHAGGTSFANQLGIAGRGGRGGELLLRTAGNVDPAELDTALTAFQPGMWVLERPPTASEDASFDAQQLGRLLHLMSKRCDYLLVDLPSVLPECYQALVRRLDHLVLVLNPYPFSIEAARERVKRLRQIGLGGARISIILVQREIGDGSDLRSTAEVVDGLRMPLSGVVPPSQRAGVAVVPVVLASLAFARIADELLAEVDHVRLKVALVTMRDDIAQRVHALLEESTAGRFDLVRATNLAAIGDEIAREEYDAILLAQDGEATDLEAAVGRLTGRLDRTAVVLITTAAEPAASYMALELGAQDQLALDHLDGYWLAHELRGAIERRRIIARLEHELKDMTVCDSDLRRMVAQLLRRSTQDPRMV